VVALSRFAHFAKRTSWCEAQSNFRRSHRKGQQSRTRIGVVIFNEFVYETGLLSDGAEVVFGISDGLLDKVCIKCIQIAILKLTRNLFESADVIQGWQFCLSCRCQKKYEPIDRL
jgi:hypothetical protein